MALITPLYLSITLVDSYRTDSEYSYNQLDSVVDGTLSGDYRAKVAHFFKLIHLFRTGQTIQIIELN